MTGGRFSVLFGGDEDKKGKACLAIISVNMDDW